MAGTSEGGRKAARTRGYKSLAEAGRKGGLHSHGGKGKGSSQAGGKETARGKSEERGKGEE